MRRTLALLTSAAVIGGIGWLTTSESGLQAAIQLAERGTAGQLHIAGASGRLLGNLDIGQLRWQAPDLQIDATEIHLDWTPASLLHGVLQIAELRMASLHIASTPSPTPTPAPTDLQLPVAVNAKKVAISTFSYGAAFVATALEGSFSSDGRQHHLDEFHALTGDVAITGHAKLDGLAPLPLDASTNITGQFDQRPLAMSLTARGPLERIALSAVATQGVAGHADVALTPFAAAAFASARIVLENLDPATWQPNA
ncbi:MAG TPA: hypothetical protein PKD66_08365, partial [Azonexus sp.]|nr:hypothetical protein [Azonexus sp.]